MDWRFITLEKLNPDALFQQEDSLFASGQERRGRSGLVIWKDFDSRLVLLWY
jgi:hypothetical protein